MKKIIGIFCAAIMALSFTLVCAASTAPDNKAGAGQSASGKSLIVYFSHTGNTETLANIIHKQVGGDITQLVPVKSYPTDYDACVDVAKKELEQQARPKLQTTIADMDSYDTVYIGYPIWWSTIPMPVATFLESYDFSGKTVVPFCTHGGSGSADSVSDIKKLIPQATVLNGLSVSGSSASNAQNSVTNWLRGINRTETEITITAGDTVITAVLNNTTTARDIVSALPLTINAKDWEDKAYYGRVHGDISTGEAQHNQLQAGDLVYWINGKAMMLYYDDTKDSKITTPVITIGRITSDLKAFENLDDAVEMRVELKQ